MNSLLLWIGGLLVAVLGLMFAAPYVIDWNAYRGVFEEEASRILGRDVRVGGAVNLRLLPSPYVRFEKVRISDSGAALGEPFFRAESFTLWLSPTPLLRGAIEASEVELDRPVLRLAVDQEGRGNWQALKIAQGSLPFLPSDVVLQQVRIRNGIVSLKMPNTAEPLTLSGIEGEVAAASLDGPYRFRGLVDWYGSPREIRVATSTREADGKLRYKASVRGPSTGNTYAIDGELSEVTPRALHSGTVTARLPISALFTPASDEAARARPSARGTDGIDFKASFSGDLDGTRLSDIAFAFEHEGKPQLMSGDAVVAWRNGMRLEVRLASRWLDLDQIAAQEGRKAMPADLTRRLIGHLSALLPPEGNSLLTMDVDQVNMGGDALSGVRLALARAGGLTSIGELRASLPGGARGELRGTLSAARPVTLRPDGTAPAADAFDGDIVLRGASYQRFAAWAGAGGLLPASPDTPDAPFSVAARMRLLPDGIAVTNANVELGRRQAVVTADWRWSGERRLEIGAEGHSIDISAFAPGVLDLTREPRQGKPAGAQPDLGSAVLGQLADRVSAIESAAGSLRLRVRAAEVSDGTTTLSDVDAELAVKAGVFSITNLKVGGGGYPRFELQGEIAGLKGKPTGALRGWVSADRPEAVARLMPLLPAAARGMAEKLTTGAGRSELGFRLTLAGTSTSAAAEQVALMVHGMLDDARVVLDMKLDGGLAQWREAPVELALRLDGPAAGPILQRVAGRKPPATSPDQTPIALFARIAGANAQSLSAVAQLDVGRSNAEYAGRAGVAADGSLELKGDMTLAAPAVSELLVLVGAGHRTHLAANPVRGTLQLERKAGMLALATSGIDVGGSRVGGRITLASRPERVRLDGELTTSRLSLVGLMGLLLDARAAQLLEDSGEEPQRAAPSPWPDATFALALLDGLDGQLTIAAAAAALTPELEITETETRLAFTPGKLEIQSLSGAALGGRFSARGSIEAAPAGAHVALDGRLTGAQLARLAAVGASPGTRVAGASGEANISLALTGRALSPRGVMAVATGKGEVEIRNGRVRGVAATLAERAATAAIEAKDEVTRASLERILSAERARSEVALGNRKLPIEIADGAVKIGALDIIEPAAALRNTTTIDLAVLRVDSEWQVSPRQPLAGAGPRREPLPSLSLIWTGPLSGIGRSDPRLAIDALEREIALRRVEREAERLEELRRQQEEERGRIEVERQKRFELEQRNIGGAAPAPVIEVPLPINPPSEQPSTPRPAARPTPSAEPPRVTRPPVRTQRQDNRTLQDMIFGQQP